MANPVAAGRKYGYPQGPQPDDELKKQYGAFANSTWQWRTNPETGMVERKAFAKNVGRVAETGGGWVVAPDYVQRAYNNPNRTGFFGSHPNASWEDFKIRSGGEQQFNAQGWTQDPATGWWTNPNNPGDRRTAAGLRIGDDGVPLGGGATTDWMGAWAPQAPGATGESMVASGSYGEPTATGTSGQRPSSNFQAGFFAGRESQPAPLTVKRKRGFGDPLNEP